MKNLWISALLIVALLSAASCQNSNNEKETEKSTDTVVAESVTEANTIAEEQTTVAEAETEVVTDAETDTMADAETETEAEAEVSTDAETETETEVVTEAVTEAEDETETDTEPTIETAPVVETKIEEMDYDVISTKSMQTCYDEFEIYRANKALDVACCQGYYLYHTNDLDGITANVGFQNLFEHGMADPDGNIIAVRLRGWMNPACYTSGSSYEKGGQVERIGYLIMEDGATSGTFVWSDSFWLTDLSNALHSAVGSATAEAFDIIVNLSELADGRYEIIPIVQTTTKTFAAMDYIFTYVKG